MKMTDKDQDVIIEALNLTIKNRDLRSVSTETGLHWLTLWKLAHGKTRHAKDSTLEKLINYYFGI
jgi:DNA-binding phage protein